MMKYLCYLPLLLLGPALYAQERIDLRGKVVDGDNGSGIASVTVRAHGNKRYTTTDNGGNFVLDNLKMPDSLSFLHLGYTEVKMVKVNDGSETYIELYPISNEIEEIEINTGYQTIKPNEMTGSFQVVDSEVLQRQTGPNILQRLNNEVVGLRFDNLSENVFGNQQLDFSVRGLSTINGPLTPLIVLDGFIYEGNISNIDPNGIESITVLKDAAATSIWGARAGNGVLVLTSKGKRIGLQPTKVSMHKSNIVKQKPNLGDIYQMDAAGFIDIEKFIFEKGYYDRTITRMPYTAFTPATEILLQQRNGNMTDIEAQAALDRLAAVDGVSNFTDAFLNAPFSDQYAVNITGGQDKNSYGFGGGYLRDKNYDASVFDKLNLQLTNSYKPITALRVDFLVHYTRSKLKSGKPGYNSFSFNGKRIPYLEFVDESNNPLAFNPSYRTSSLEEMYGTGYLDWNLYPLDNSRYSYSGTNVEEINSNVNIGYRLFSFLDANLGMQYQLQRTETQSVDEIESYQARLLVNGFSTIDATTGLMTYNVPLGGILASNNQNGSSYTLRGQLNVRESWKRHGIVGIIGGETRQNLVEGNSVTAYGYSEDPLTTVRVDYTKTFRTIPTGGSRNISGPPLLSRSVNRFISLYSNWVYTLDNKYNLSFSVRRDGANVFGATTNDKWNPFWSLGASWNVASEPFMANSVIDNLKLRTTYGYSGNVDLSKTPLPIGQTSIGAYTNYPAIVIGTLNDPSLRWEQISTLNFGVDFSVLENILSGNIDLYFKNGKDLYGLTTYDYTVWGQQGTVVKNTARMKSNGLDVALHSRNIQGRLRWDTRLFLAINKDRTVEYYARNSNDITAFLSSSAITPVVGRPLYGIAGYRWAGLDAEGNPQGYLGGEPSTNYTAIRAEAASLGLEGSNVVFIGSSKPQLFGSVINTFSYKGFSLTFNVSFKGDYYFRGPRTSYTALFADGVAYADIERRWKEPGDEAKTDMPSMVYPSVGNRDSFYGQSEIHALRADHLRLEYVNLSWQPNLKVGNRAVMPEVYLNASNLGVLWRKNGEDIDPEYSNRLRPLRTMSLGLRIAL